MENNYEMDPNYSNKCPVISNVDAYVAPDENKYETTENEYETIENEYETVGNDGDEAVKMDSHCKSGENQYDNNSDHHNIIWNVR